jgi:hypothetical protein
VLGARKAVEQGLIALEMSLRGLLRTFLLRGGVKSRGWFKRRIGEQAAGDPMLVAATEPLLRARCVLRQGLVWRGWSAVSAHWPGMIPRTLG